MTTLARPIKLIPQWHGHGKVVVLVDGTYIYLRADDVDALAGLTPWDTGEALITDGWPLLVDGTAVYPLDDALERCDTADTELAAAFAAWIRTELSDYVTPDAIEQARPAVSLAGACTVQYAADTISRAVGRRISRLALFQHLASIGWITRRDETADWEATRAATDARYITTRTVPVRGRSYRQIYITPAGLDDLTRDVTAGLDLLILDTQ